MSASAAPLIQEPEPEEPAEELPAEELGKPVTAPVGAAPSRPVQWPTTIAVTALMLPSPVYAVVLLYFIEVPLDMRGIFTSPKGPHELTVFGASSLFVWLIAGTAWLLSVLIQEPGLEKTNLLRPRQLVPIFTLWVGCLACFFETGFFNVPITIGSFLMFFIVAFALKGLINAVRDFQAELFDSCIKAQVRVAIPTLAFQSAIAIYAVQGLFRWPSLRGLGLPTLGSWAIDGADVLGCDDEDEQAFLELWVNTTGCTTPLCGFVSWRAACGVSLFAPLANTVIQDAVSVLVQPTGTWILALVFYGSGRIKARDDGTVDYSHLETPAVVASLALFGVSCAIALFKLVRLLSTVPMLLAPLGGVPPPSLAPPSFCYGTCNVWLQFGFVVLWGAILLLINLDLAKRCCGIDRSAKLARLAARAPLLDEQQYETLAAAARGAWRAAHGLVDEESGGESAPAGEDPERFLGEVNDLVSGQAEEAALGIANYMGIAEATLAQRKHMSVAQVLAALEPPPSSAAAAAAAAAAGAAATPGPLEEQLRHFPGGRARYAELLRASSDLEGVAAVAHEFLAHGTPEDLEWLEYCLGQPATPRRMPHGLRDAGRGGESLADFCSHRFARAAQLSGGNVLALRMYTTAAFKSLNRPLRDVERREDGSVRLPPRIRTAHLLPVTVKLIEEGLKKLRALHTADGGAGVSMPLWRGMKNLRLTEAFERRGGTELAPMSTTEDLHVAAHFSAGAQSLLFKISPTSFMQRGANLQWLSAFPQECECLYPPLTFLQPTGRKQTVVINACEGPARSPGSRQSKADGADATAAAKLTFVVVELVPHYPS